jgi:tetratricopeptide (TPR) repeat protein
MTLWIGLIALGLGLGTSLFIPVPQTLKTNFDAGQSLYALGEYEGAILEYSKIVKFDSRAVRTDSVRVSFGDELELPVMAAAWYQLGNARMRSGQHEEAVDAFREVIAMEGVEENFQSLVQFRVAETRFLQKEYEKAAEEYKRYAELFPTSDLAGEAYFYSGWSQFNLERYDDAISTLRGMLEAYPGDRYASDSQFRIASSYYEKEQYQKAVDEAEIVLEEYPSSPVIAQATYLKAQAFDQMERSGEAIASYREVRDLYDRMYELLRGSFREGKNVDFDNYRQLFETSSLRVAEIYRRNGQFEEAYQELIAAQETAEERFYKAKVQMRLGDNYMEWGQRVKDQAQKQKRFEEAYTTYNQVIELYGDTPYPPIAQYNKGEARYFAGDYGEARQEYTAVATLYPDSETGLRANALYSAAWSSEKLDDFEAALDMYGQVVESFPRSDQAPLCLLRMGRVNTEQQRFDEAIEAYRIVAENYGETRHAADANYGLGLLYKQRGELDSAIDAFSRVGREAGEVYVASLIEAANIHIGEGRSEEGRQVLDQLLAGVTGDRTLEAQAHYQIAQLDLNNDNYLDAINRYTKVIEEYPEAKVIREVRYGRALAYHKANRFSRALADYQWLLDQNLLESMALKVNFAMALSFAAQGQDAEATKLLTQVIESGDETLARNAQLQLISMAEKQDPEDAIRTYEDMLSRLTTQEDKVRVLIRMASAYFRLGRYEQSVAASQQLLDLAIDAEDIANALFVQGNSHFRAGELEKAIQTYQTIVDNYPQIGWARNAQFQIGAAYNQMSGDGNVQYLPYVAEAFQSYYTAYADDEKAVYAYYYSAFAEYRMGRWRESSETFQELASRFPRSEFAPQSLFRAGEAVFNLAQGESRENKKGVFRDAMRKYDSVLGRYPRSGVVDDALYNKAWAIIHLSDLGEEYTKADALPFFERIVAEHPDGDFGAASQFTLGDYYYGEKEYDLASASYRKFLELYPEQRLKAKDRPLRRKASVLLGHLSEIEAYNVYAAGESLFDGEQYEEAIEIFKDVIERFPESDQAVNAAVNIASAYMALEEYRKAAEEFQQVVQKYGNIQRFSPQVDFSRQQLQVLEEARVL